MGLTPTQSPPRTTQRIPHNPFADTPEHGLYVEALRTLATVPRVQVTCHLAEQTVDRLAPSFVYHGRRTCYRSRRLRVIARKVHRLIHSDAWQDAGQPVASAAYRERCRQRGIISGWSRRVLSDERDLRIINLLEAGYTPDEAARLVGCSVRTVYRARNRVRLGCDTNTTSSRSDSPERSTEEIREDEEIQTTQRPRATARSRGQDARAAMWARIMANKHAAHVARSGRGQSRHLARLIQREEDMEQRVQASNGLDVYTVDVEIGRCSCPAAQFRPDKACKHLRAASAFNRRAHVAITPLREAS